VVVVMVMVLDGGGDGDGVGCGGGDGDGDGDGDGETGSAIFRYCKALAKQRKKDCRAIKAFAAAMRLLSDIERYILLSSDTDLQLRNQKRYIQ
jgi:hypothetical protein